MVGKIRNFRQITGTNLYRCGRPETGNNEDFIELRDQIGIKTIIDLRSKQERKKLNPQELANLDRFYWSCPENDNISRGLTVGKFYHIDMVGGHAVIQAIFARLPWYIKLLCLVLSIVQLVTGKDLAFKLALSYTVNPLGIIGWYTGIVDFCGENICKVLKMLSEESNLPCIVCCSAGKDRTGIITALVLSELGFSREFIAQDYGKSAEGLPEFHAAVREGFLSMGLTDPDFLGADEQTMLRLLEYIDTKYGSVSDYLNSIGFGIADQARLRLAMTSTSTDDKSSDL